MANILIVGGTGFVGSAVVRAALAADHTVTLLNRGSRTVSGTRQLTADRNSAAALGRALAGRSFDVVLDTNAYTGEQARLLLSALGEVISRAVVISSASVYEDHAIQPPDEDQPVGGASVWGAYGYDKAEMEAVYRQAKTLDHCAIVRPPYIFGPGNSGDRETWFWSRQLNDAVTLLPGDGRTRAHFVHCDDVAAALLRLGTEPRKGLEIFNVADAQSLSFSELASMLAEVAGVEDRQFAIGPLGDGVVVRSWFPFRDYPCLTEPRKILTQTDWRPAYSLKERFRQTFLIYSAENLRSAYSLSDSEGALAQKLFQLS